MDAGQSYPALLHRLNWEVAEQSLLRQAPRRCRLEGE